VRDDRHPLDRAYAELRDATLRRAAAREAVQDADSSQRIIIEQRHAPTSLVPSSTRAKVTAAGAAIGGVVWMLYELWTLLRGAR
jgi:hypothetical protein